MHLNVSKTYSVIILTEELDTFYQGQSMARKYMNRFVIEEDDQFEIHVKDYTNKWWIGEKAVYNAAKELMLKAQQG